MRISKFTYKGVERVAAELGNDPRGCGLLTVQLMPQRGIRTFVPGRMMDCREVKGLSRLYWWLRWRLSV